MTAFSNKFLYMFKFCSTFRKGSISLCCFITRAWINQDPLSNSKVDCHEVLEHAQGALIHKLRLLHGNNTVPQGSLHFPKELPLVVARIPELSCHKTARVGYISTFSVTDAVPLAITVLVRVSMYPSIAESSVNTQPTTREISDTTSERLSHSKNY